ncbi:MAG: FHA domain-containing protein [Actinomycetia bacterium]|nr:FHA domain-containing protein [Actinomycetes bacterium]
MGLISDFEEHLGGAIEGAFAGMFKSPVQPAELARACSKEMSRSKKLGIGTVYVANVYSILLSTRDHSTLAGLLPTLQGELETYLLAYAREHDFQMTTRPVVRFYPTPDLKLGRFEAIGDLLSVAEIEAELGPVPGVTPEPVAGPAPARPAARGAEVAVAAPGFAPEPAPAAMPDSARPMPRLRHDPEIPASVQRAKTFGFPPEADLVPDPPADATTQGPRLEASLSMDALGELSLQGKQSVTIGRQDDNDLVIADVNASRHHARFERAGDGWELTDLGSTNGTLLNGQKTTRARLHDGDVILIGVTKIAYHEKASRL